MISQPQTQHQNPYVNAVSATSSTASTNSSNSTASSTSSNLLLATTSLTTATAASTQQHHHLHQSYYNQEQPERPMVNTISHLVSASKYYHHQNVNNDNERPENNDNNTDDGVNDMMYKSNTLPSQNMVAYSRAATNSSAFDERSLSSNHNNQHKYRPTIQQSKSTSGGENVPVYSSTTNSLSKSQSQNYMQPTSTSSNKLDKDGSGSLYHHQQQNQHHYLNQSQHQQPQQPQHRHHVSSASSSTAVTTLPRSTADRSMISHHNPPPPVATMPSNTSAVYEHINTKDRSMIREQHDSQHSRRNCDDEDLFDEQQKIRVQILPQDDNWGESNTTALTADLSDINDDAMTEDGRSMRYQPKWQQYGGETNPYPKSSSFVVSTRRFLGKHVSLLFTGAVILSSLLTPILFIILPRMELTPDWQLAECGLECEGALISISFKLSILILGYWAMYMRPQQQQQSLPRLFELKLLLVLTLFIATFSYWLFYSVRIIDVYVSDYFKILQFTASYVDVQLFIFVVSVFVLELRHLQPSYVVRVVRSPDGLMREYDLGGMSIQRAALFILQQYYRDFNVYNPWLESAHRKRTAQLVQLEQINSKRRAASRNQGGNNESSSRANSIRRNGEDNDDKNPTTEASTENELNCYGKQRTGSSRRSVGSSKPLDVQSITNIAGANLSATDRLYEEYEYERRLKKRRARLITTTEEAFGNIRRIQAEAAAGDEESSQQQQRVAMDPFETAQALFSTIARDLRRYLRLTRQHPYFTREAIVSHLANCIAYDLSPKAFLQKFIEGESVLFNERALINQYNHLKHMRYQQELAAKQEEQKLSGQHVGNNYTSSIKTLDQTWILISDNALYQNIEDNLMIVLKQNDVTLMCSFKRLPRFKLIEDILDPKRNKFVLKLNSETTV